MREDCVDRFALACPGDRARLTQPDPVSKALTRELDPVGLPFHAEAGAAERAGAELPADNGPEALSPDHQLLLASHADTSRPACGVTADDRDLVEMPSDRGVQGGVEDPTQVVPFEGQVPVVARSRHTEAVPNTGEILWGRSAPDVGGRAGVTAAVSMEQRLNRAVSVGDDLPRGSGRRRRQRGERPWPADDPAACRPGSAWSSRGRTRRARGGPGWRGRRSGRASPGAARAGRSRRRPLQRAASRPGPSRGRTPRAVSSGVGDRRRRRPRPAASAERSAVAPEAAERAAAWLRRRVAPAAIARMSSVLVEHLDRSQKGTGGSLLGTRCLSVVRAHCCTTQDSSAFGRRCISEGAEMASAERGHA